MTQFNDGNRERLLCQTKTRSCEICLKVIDLFKRLLQMSLQRASKIFHVSHELVRSCLKINKWDLYKSQYLHLLEEDYSALLSFELDELTSY